MGTREGGGGAGGRQGVLRLPLGRPEEARPEAVGSLAPFSACPGVARAEGGFGGRPARLTETVGSSRGRLCSGPLRPRSFQEASGWEQGVVRAERLWRRHTVPAFAIVGIQAPEVAGMVPEARLSRLGSRFLQVAALGTSGKLLLSCEVGAVIACALST